MKTFPALSRRLRSTISLTLRSCVALGLVGLAHAATIPANLGAGLAQIVQQRQSATSGAAARSLAPAASDMTTDLETHMLWDEQGRVLVTVVVDAKHGFAGVRRAVQEIAGVVLVAEDAKYRAGVLELFAPIESLTRLAKTPGVSAVHAVVRPERNVGAVTQQGVAQHRVDRLALDGVGITVGVISDSYNTAANFLSGAPLTIRAANDVASGDLPGTGNPLGNTEPVVVLQDFGVYPNTSVIDEGRAMMQLIHDIAPKARLGFATGGFGEVTFANNIRALAGVQGLPSSRPDFAAQIIVDDLSYSTEGMFADTIIAQAVDEVTALGVSYFSSAGNRPPTQGYASDFRLVPVSGAALAGTNLNFADVPPALYAGGFHNFRSDGGQDIAQTIQLAPPTGTATRATTSFSLQWDDPYDQTANVIGPVVFTGSGTLTAGTPQVDFVFNNPIPGQQYQIDVRGTSTKTPGSSLDVIVALIQPDGSTLVTQDTGNEETLTIFLPQAGNHIIRVTGFDDGTGPDQGPFSVVVNQTSGVARVTTDFNVLFFRADTGAFLGQIAENNLATNRPVEVSGTISFPPGLSQVQMVVARANTPTAPIPASRLRYQFRDNISFPVEYFSYFTPVTFGHNSAAGANGVAAYGPFPPNIPEDFTSTGPVRIVWDRDGNRIPDAQQIRLKPDFAAMDGGNTTFFTSDTARDLDTLPNFFGTSAAAPNAAAIAALVLQSKGGPGSVTPAQMKTILQRSAFPHDLDPYSARGMATATNGGKVTVTVNGDNSVSSQGDPNAMTISYVGPGSIATIWFDASTGNPGGGNVVTPSTPGLVFDFRPNDGSLVTGGQTFIIGPASMGLTPSDVAPFVFGPAPAPSVPGQYFGLLLNFAPGAFTGGKALRFGVDRDEYRSAFAPPTGDSRNGSSADLTGSGVRIPSGVVVPGGVTFAGALSDGSTFRGTLTNRIGAGWTFLDGFGFVNAESAVNQPLP